jgi:tetratricopeptide (TPR) repeat protein
MSAALTLRGRTYVAKASNVTASGSQFGEIVVNAGGQVTETRAQSYDLAIDDFTKAIKLEPNNGLNYRERGRAYALKKDYDKAIADFNRAIQLDPGHAKAYNNRGLAFALKGDHDKAIADYDQAISLDPNLAQTYYNRGNTYTRKGEDEKAIADFEAALRIDPDHTGARWNLEQIKPPEAAAAEPVAAPKTAEDDGNE